MLAFRQVQSLYLLAKRSRGLKYPEVGLQARAYKAAEWETGD